MWSSDVLHPIILIGLLEYISKYIRIHVIVAITGFSLIYVLTSHSLQHKINNFLLIEKFHLLTATSNPSLLQPSRWITTNYVKFDLLTSRNGRSIISLNKNRVMSEWIEKTI